MLSSERGIATIALLFIMTLIWSITLLIILETRSTLQMRASTISQLKADSIAVTKAMQSAAGQITTAGLRCLDSDAEYKKGVAVANSCVATTLFQGSQLSARSPAGITLQANAPIFKLNAIFSRPILCDTTHNALQNKSYFNTPLSVTSSAWSTTCLTAVPTAGNVTAHLGNLALGTTVKIGPSAMTTPFTLAATGYVELNSALEVESDLVIIGGGDVFIRSLNNISTVAKRVSIFSLSGSVIIKETKGYPQMIAYGWLGTQVAGAYQEQTVPLLPTLVNSMPISVGRDH